MTDKLGQTVEEPKLRQDNRLLVSNKKNLWNLFKVYKNPGNYKNCVRLFLQCLILKWLTRIEYVSVCIRSPGMHGELRTVLWGSAEQCRRALLGRGIQVTSHWLTCPADCWAATAAPCYRCKHKYIHCISAYSKWNNELI